MSQTRRTMKTRNTLMAHIPPMEIGNQGSEHCEETKIDRGIYNRTITDKFHQYVKMTDLVKENVDGSILTKDGYHLTVKGGERAAAQLERAIKSLKARNKQGNPPTPSLSTTSKRHSHNQQPTRDHPKQQTRG